ncbi:MAG: hypothetical protein JXR37_37545 [Kiritimatiellae bacterium]|nr:hypothetical protein [Kiritimatiellia bacterium]
MDTDITDMEDAPRAASIRSEVDAFFKPGGVLEKACDGAPFPYEPRPQQREMANAVAEAFSAGGHLIVEAGTGVGKSFAYLVPAILAATRAQTQVVVSTYTISLQEQLLLKDVPFLREHLGVAFNAALVKGRGNYLCRRRLGLALKQGADLFDGSRETELERIRRWAEHTADGSLSDFERQPARELWGHVCAEHGNCLGRQCPHFKACFFMRARSRAYGAELLVVNHHLFFSELRLRAQGAGFLPPHEIAVFDEAHCMEAVASEHLGIRLSPYGFEYLLRRLYDPASGKGVLSALGETTAMRAVGEAWKEVESLFDAVAGWVGDPARATQKIVREPLALETGLPEQLARISAALRAAADRIEDPDMKAELGGLERRTAEMREGLAGFLAQSMPDHVYWVEKEGYRRGRFALLSAPIEVGGLLEELAFNALSAMVLTSATLAVGGALDYFKQRIGARASRTLCVGSPFNYERQMRLYVARDMPDPNDSEAFALGCAEAVKHFARLTHGRAFVLFTNAALMKKVAGLTEDFFAEHGLTLLVQGRGLPRHLMLDQFREQGASVLFGLDSFWMGVDVRGEALSNVIITRLPFSVPDQPVVTARMERIRERGGNPFREYALPEAILKFRQGVGRLIRTATDEGIVVVLDNRIVTRWYGRQFLASIPPCQTEAVVLS